MYMLTECWSFLSVISCNNPFAATGGAVASRHANGHENITQAYPALPVNYSEASRVFDLSCCQNA